MANTIRTPFGEDVQATGAVAGTNVSVQELGDGILHKTIITLDAETITITDDAGVAQYGGTKIYDFPKGLLTTFGAIVVGNLTGGVTGTVIATFDGDVSLGTATATTGATLITTQADILQSTATTIAVAKVAPVLAVSAATALTESGARWHDGTTTAKDLFLNFKIDDSVTHTSGTATFTGTVTLLWTIIGDK